MPSAAIRALPMRMQDWQRRWSGKDARRKRLRSGRRPRRCGSRRCHSGIVRRSFLRLLVPEDVAEAGDRAPGFGGPHPALPESLGGGEVLVEVNEEEVGDEFWVSHGEAKLA